MKFRTSVVIPVLLPFMEDEYITALVPRAVDGLCRIEDGFTYRSEWGKRVPFLASRLQQPSDFPEFAAEWPESTGVREYHYVRLDAEVEVDIEEYYHTLRRNNPHHPQLSREEAIHFAGDATVSELSTVAGHLVLALNIAYPGAIETGRRYQFVEDQFVRSESGFVSRLAKANSEARKLGWPPLRELRVESVWRWMTEIPGLEEGHTRGPAGRALSALSYLFSDRYDGSPVVDLVWALVGLEALYGKGNLGLKGQLLEKSEVVLGPRTAYKKRFGSMYDFRSRFVHGDIDFPLAYVDSSSFGPERFDREAGESLFVAAAMLIATLQQLVGRGLHELSFSYTLDI
jgi:hypothetical protein